MFQKLRINRSIKVLSKAETCFPIDIFSISRAISEIKDPTYLRSLVVAYGSNRNAFVRRCILTSIRFSSEYTATAAKDNAQYISSMLNDVNAWVIYDACWLVMDHGYMSPSDSIILKEIAGNMINLSLDELEKLKPNEASGYAAKMAAQAIYAQQSNLNGSTFL